MLIFEIRPIDANYPWSGDLMEDMWLAISNVFLTQNFLRGIHSGFKVNISSLGINVSYPGICPKDGATSNYLFREINRFIAMANVEHLFVKGVAYREENGDFVFDQNKFKPSSTSSTKLLKKYTPAIPEGYECSLTQEIMDHPVYLKTRPDVKYELTQLKYWLYCQDLPKDPITQIPINPSIDIIDDLELKIQIDKFVKEKFKEILEAEKAALMELLKKYNLTTSMQNMEKAFRQAAASNNVEDLKIIYQRVDVNSRDATPNKMKTALHWAIERKAPDSIKFLLTLKELSLDIKDAKGKTALDYVKESDSNEIKELFMIKPVQPSQTQPRFR